MVVNGTTYDCSSDPLCCPPTGANSSYYNIEATCTNPDGTSNNATVTHDFPIGSACPHSGVATDADGVFKKDANGDTLLPPQYSVTCSCSARTTSKCVDAQTSKAGAEDSNLAVRP